MEKSELVFQTCIVLVQHFSNLVKGGRGGFHTRIFQYIIHPEYEFVGMGQSPEVTLESGEYPEHVVPCAVLIKESIRLVKEGKYSNEEIAKLLQKHWKVAKITPEQARFIDQKPGCKSSMPKGWNFETGDTLARIKAANIRIIPIEENRLSADWSGHMRGSLAS